MKSLVLLAVLGLGCSNPCGPNENDSDGMMCYENIDRTLSISNSFTLEQKQKIEEAGFMWGNATNNVVKLSFTYASNNDADIIVHYCGPVCAGLEHTKNNMIELNAAVIPEHLFLGSALHELGHSFGLGHSESIADVMFAQTHENTYITQADIDHFNKVMNEGIY